MINKHSYRLVKYFTAFLECIHACPHESLKAKMSRPNFTSNKSVKALFSINSGYYILNRTSRVFQPGPSRTIAHLGSLRGFIEILGHKGRILNVHFYLQDESEAVSNPRVGERHAFIGEALGM